MIKIVNQHFATNEKNSFQRGSNQVFLNVCSC